MTSSKVGVGSRDRYEIDIHQVQLGVPMTERIRLDFDVAHETMTGASPWYVEPDAHGKPLQVMTGATIDGSAHRRAATAPCSSTAAARPSRPASRSRTTTSPINGGLGRERYFNEKNTTLSGGVGVSVDRLTPTEPEHVPPTPTRRRSRPARSSAGFAQVLGRSVGDPEHAQYQFANGFLVDPYKLVSVGGTNLAGHRARHAPPVRRG